MTRATASKEIYLHLPVAAFLDQFASKDWVWTHIGHGEARTARAGAKLKRMGVKPGWPDFVFVGPSGRVYFLELKREGGRLSKSQDAFRDYCVKRGIPHVVARTIGEAMTAFDSWGITQLRQLPGNRLTE